MPPITLHTLEVPKLKSDNIENPTIDSIENTAIFNQLYNTNFERWTNSGLGQGTGSGRQTDFNVSNKFTDTDGSSFASWVGTDCNITDGGTHLLITQSGGTTQYAKYALSGLTVGKRYKFVCTIANGTGTLGFGDKIRVEENGGTHIRSCRTESANTYSILWEAKGATDKIVIVATLGAGQTIQVSNVYVDECHHGCVDADTLAADTHSKTSTLDVFREWNADSANTYGYGKFLLKTVKGDNGAEYYNFDTINIDYRDAQGRVVSFGCFVYAVQDNNVKLSIYDGQSEIALSTTYCPAGELTWMEVTGTVALNATKVQPRILLDGASADVAYLSHPALQYGSFIGENNYRAGSTLELPHAQVSSSENQSVVTTATVPITFNSNDDITGIIHNTSVDKSKIKMVIEGTYEIIISALADCTSGTNTYLENWLEVNAALQRSMELQSVDFTKVQNAELYSVM